MQALVGEWQQLSGSLVTSRRGLHTYSFVLRLRHAMERTGRTALRKYRADVRNIAYGKPFAQSSLIRKFEQRASCCTAICRLVQP